MAQITTLVGDQAKKIAQPLKARLTTKNTWNPALNFGEPLKIK